jgi:hypothetical protein
MPVDTSIYGNLKGPPQLDIKSLIDMARSAQRLQGESAIGDIYKDAATGDPNNPIDAGKLGTMAPRAGVLAPAIAQQSQSLAQGQQTIDRNKLDNIRQWWGTLDQELYSLMNKPDLTHKDVLDSIHGLIGHKDSELNGGIFTPQLATQASAWLWGPNGQPLPPDQIRKTIGQFHQRVQGNLQSSEYIPVGVDPNTGQPLFMTRNGAIARDSALPRGGAGAAGAGGGGGALPPARTPPGAAPPAAAAPPPGVVMQPGGVPAMPAGLAPGGAESAQEMRGDLSRQANFGQEMAPWQEALKAANDLRTKYGEGYFGPGSKGRQDFESYFYSLAPQVAQWAGVDPEKLRDYAKADKYLTQGVQSRAAGFGAHTDQQLATTISGSPNVHVNDLAVDDVIKTAMSLRRAEYAQVQQSKKAGGPGYTEAKADWASKNDVRAFSLDLLSPEARAKLLGSLKKGTPEYERFNNSLQAAYESGVMDRPSATTTVAPLAPGGRKDTSRATSGEAIRSLPPDPNASPPKPPVPGVQLGRRPDGSPAWYIPDPARPGKHMEIRMPGM